MKNFDLDQIEKVDDIPPSYFWATINKLGGLEKWKALMRGKFFVELVVAPRLFFDRHGRFIPFSDIISAVCDPDPRCHFSQPEINYGKILRRIRRCLAVGLHQKPVDIKLTSVNEFGERIVALKAKLDADHRTVNATKGIWLPIVLPQLQCLSENKGIYGVLLNQFVDGVASAYAASYPSRIFTNHAERNLTGNVSIFSGSRHERLIEEMARGPVVGIVLLPFGGYSVDACREIWSKHELSPQIPDWMFLGGGLDTAVAYMAFAKELCRDYDTPAVNCPAIAFRSALLRFNAQESDAYFADLDFPSLTKNNYSGSVFCLG